MGTIASVGALAAILVWAYSPLNRAVRGAVAPCLLYRWGIVIILAALLLTKLPRPSALQRRAARLLLRKRTLYMSLPPLKAVAKQVLGCSAH
jgi:hypothetical protein